MSKSVQQEHSKNYRFFNDIRPDYQIQLTNRLARSLSESNLLNLSKGYSETLQTSKTIKKEQILYVCLPGVPPFQNEFQSLKLPGQCLFFKNLSFETGYSEEQMKDLPTQWENQAKILNDKINKYRTTKPIVFVYHSFGTYLFATYNKLYPNNRIIGLIDVGGAPIRFYPAINFYISQYESIPMESIKQNLDDYFEIHRKRSLSLKLTPYDHKYQLLGIIRSTKSGMGFANMFDYVRSVPNVLKCFIYGRKDSIFLQSFVNQKVAFFSYKNVGSQEYRNQLKLAYKKMYKVDCQNVQQKFIFNIENGFHSIHVQKRYKELVAQIVNNYLVFLEEVYALPETKL